MGWCRNPHYSKGSQVVSTLCQISGAKFRYKPKKGNYVSIEISDTGIGMDENTMNQLFEPFFTTKESGKGTGLGLASVYGIVKGHAGYIDVESQLGKGTKFSIHFPAVEKKVNKQSFERSRH